ncbi:MAG: hypothetical protein QF662_06135, partial [Phycisphaerae bacterium]|nr:hypothetical protein [Phycisphaerae bacterium]
GAIFNVSGLLRLAGRSAAAIGLNYPTPLALAAVGGIVWSVKEKGSSMGRLLLVMAVVYFAFAVRYPIQPQHTFFVPFYAVCSILIGMGLAQIQIDKKAWRVALGCVLALLPIGVYAALPAAVRWADIPAVKAELARRVLPYRDPYRYFLQPWLRNYRGARRFAEEALAQVPQDAIILADNTSSAPLKYVQDVEGVRQDVMIVDLYDARFDPALEKYWHSEKNFLPSVSPKRVFIVSNVPGYFPEWIYRGCVLVKAGVLYEVKAEEDS